MEVNYALSYKVLSNANIANSKIPDARKTYNRDEIGCQNRSAEHSKLMIIFAQNDLHADAGESSTSTFTEPPRTSAERRVKASEICSINSFIVSRLLKQTGEQLSRTKHENAKKRTKKALVCHSFKAPEDDGYDPP